MLEVKQEFRGRLPWVMRQLLGLSGGSEVNGRQLRYHGEHRLRVGMQGLQRGGQGCVARLLLLVIQ